MEKIVGTSNHAGKVKSMITRAYRGNVKQAMVTNNTEVPTQEAVDDLADRVDLARGKKKMKHKFVGSVDIATKAQHYADAHHIDLEKAAEITYHRAIGK